MLAGRVLKKNFERIVEVSDGFDPTDTYVKTFGMDLNAALTKLRITMADGDRDPDALHNAFLYSELSLYDRARDNYEVDAPSRADLKSLEEQGFKAVLIGVPTFSKEHSLLALDHVYDATWPWVS